KLYKITEGVVSPASGSNQSPNISRAFKGRIRIMYTGYYLNIYIKNEGEPFYIVKNKAFKALYFAPNSGKVDVTFGFMFCYGEAECDASVSTATISSSLALPTLSSSSESTFTSSSSTSTSSSSSSSSSSVVATISQQAEKCDTSKSIVPFSVVSNGAKKYDFSKPITFPCNKDGFDMDIDVETEDDLYLMLTDKNGYSPSDSVIEISFNFRDKLYKITEGVVSPASGSNQSPNISRAFKGRIRIMYTGYYLNIYIKNEGEPFYIVKNKAFKALYFAPNSGKVDVTFGFMFCYGEAECDASVSTATISSSSALPTLSSSSESTLTSSSVPSHSSSSESTLTSSSELIFTSKAESSSSSLSIYISSSELICDTYSSFMNISVASIPYVKTYDLNNPISIPCASSDFQLDFDIDSDSDIYVAFTDLDGFSSAYGYSESYFGFSSGIYDITRYSIAKNTNITASITQPRHSGHLTLTYKKGILSLYDSDEFEVSYKIKNLEIKQVFISTYTGTAKISNGLFTCSSVIKC
ncbi:hypothetical protein AYI69_g7355, partial [Smittium culicis]